MILEFSVSETTGGEGGVFASVAGSGKRNTVWVEWKDPDSAFALLGGGDWRVNKMPRTLGIFFLEGRGGEAGLRVNKMRNAR